MSIFTRTRDIVAANFSDLLEKAEDPAKTVRVMIMEMEETLVEVRAAAARTIADQKEMRRQVARLEMLQANWTEKAELALSKDREDLAKAALVERQKLRDVAEQIEGEVALLDASMRAADADIAKLQAKLREARSRQTQIAARLESAETRIRLREAYAGAKVEEAFAGFSLLERRADLQEGRAEALALAAPGLSLEQEIAALRASDQIEAELAAMKAASRG
jgi:phage shock protein A